MPGPGDMVRSNLKKALLLRSSSNGEKEIINRRNAPRRTLESAKLYGEYEARKEDWACWCVMGASVREVAPLDKSG